MTGLPAASSPPRLGVGSIDVFALDDGLMHVPPSFYVGFDAESHADMVAPDGTIHVPIGCFLIRTEGTVLLVDAGVGQIPMRSVEGGLLKAQLAGIGVAPADVDRVFCTHLHLDHIGGLLDDDKPFFPNAVISFGEADWAQFVENDSGRRLSWIEQRIHGQMLTLADVADLDPLSEDMIAVAPGVTARLTPGHTWGHYGLIVSSEGERAYLLGDAIECPLQIEEPDIHVMTDIDANLARRTGTSCCERSRVATRSSALRISRTSGSGGF